MPRVHQGMHAVFGEDHRRARRLRRLWFVSLEDQPALFFQARHFDSQMDARDLVMVRHGFHGSGRSRVIARFQVIQERQAHGVHKTDVRGGIRAPGLAHDALHAALNLLRRGAAVVHGELHEEQVRLELQHIMLRAKDSEV